MSIATEIIRLQNAKAALKESIEAKGVTVASDATLDAYPALVDSISSGGSGVSSKYSEPDVIFFDYDGSVVESYTKDEFLSLSELPENPNHTSEGLVSQGWTKTLSQAKTYVQNYGCIRIGQMYDTIDGKTRVFITVPYNGFEFSLYVKPYNSTSGCKINWGDGQETSITFTNVYTHLYAQSGDFIISIESDSGKPFYFYNDGNTSSTICGGIKQQSSAQIIKKIFLGSLYSNRLRTYTFKKLQQLTCITIPNTIVTFDSSLFVECNSIKSITFPNLITSIDGNEFFYQCFALTYIDFPSIQFSVTSSYFLSMCFSLKTICIPEGCTRFNFGTLPALERFTIPTTITKLEGTIDMNSIKEVIIPDGIDFSAAFSSGGYSYPTSLQKVVFNCSLQNMPSLRYAIGLKELKFPNNVQSLSNSCFDHVYGLEEIIIPNTVSSIGNNAFNNCYAKKIKFPSQITTIPSSCCLNCVLLDNVIIPNSVTSIETSAFAGCYSLTNIELNEGLLTLGDGVFNSCHALKKITIPSTVTSIGSAAFAYIEGLKEVYVLATTPPSGTSDMFSSQANDLIIYVPAASVEDYKAATNWSNYASKIQAIPA